MNRGNTLLVSKKDSLKIIEREVKCRLQCISPDAGCKEEPPVSCSNLQLLKFLISTRWPDSPRNRFFGNNL
jgi:hypothetical protein